MPTKIHAKTLLSSFKEGSDTWFGIRYNLNLYRGCQHGCIYCDSRSKCYGIENFSEIQIKVNALQLLEKELSSKKMKGTIGFGSMNDPYMPLEKKAEMTRRALEIVSKYHFPLHIITKSNLVVRDIDIIKSIAKVYAAISITVTTSDDKLSGIIEPGAPISSERFAAIKELSEHGIYCGIVLVPVLPFITDDPANIRAIVTKASQAGAKYVLAGMGMTIREGQREYFYEQLDKKFPGLKDKYIRLYGRNYSCNVPDHDKLQGLFTSVCNDLQMPQRMEFYRPPLQMKLFSQV